MQSRSFTDVSGIEWRVRATMPSSRAAAALPVAYSHGWLVFESPAGAVRRLAPIPDGWETMPASALSRLCQSAVPSKGRDGMTGEGMRYEPGRRPAGP